MKNRKGQLSLGDAPTVVLLVGLVFLVMATFAFIGEKYGDSIDEDNTAVTITNESATRATIITGANLAVKLRENGACSSLTAVYNGTGGAYIKPGNFSLSSACVLTNSSKLLTYSSTTYLVSYTGTYSLQTASANVTNDMQTEIGNNTSIAGIVLTISLVGIVLTVLIGVFLGMSRRTRI